MLRVNEAITNAVKHARCGCVYAGVQNGTVWVGVVDHGRGICSFVLPQALLRRGFSTTTSMGLGYSIMLDVADYILLSTSDKGTKVLLMKYVAPQPTGFSLDALPDTW